MDRLRAALAVAKYAYPHQRIGQLLVNALSIARPMADAELHRVLFYMSDDDLAKAVEQYAQRPEALPRTRSDPRP